VIVFADTSGLFALLAHDDAMHARAKLNFSYFSAHDVRLMSSSYVLLETIALLHRRIGIAAVADFQAKIVPLLEIVWVDAEWHARALQRLFALGRKDVSLVDCLSFEVMEARNLRTVFSFDKHFEERGFSLAAFHDLDARRGGSSRAQPGE
jgi:predicted nucleic acid-binding protein